MIENLFDLPAAVRGQVEKLAHANAHIDTDSTNDSRGTDREVIRELGADDINLLAHFNEDDIPSISIKDNAIGILVIKCLASFRLVEQNVGVTMRSNRDALYGTPINKAENLGCIVKGRRETFENDTSDTRSL